MKEFSNLIQVTPIEGAQQQSYTFMADHFDFQPESSDEESGMSWNCDHTFVIDRPDDDTVRFFCIPRSATVTFRDSGGKSYRIGTVSVPAKVSITAHLYRCRLVISCKMLTNPLI